MSTAMPTVAHMITIPAVAQKRAGNFTIAEAKAISFAATAEAEQGLPDIPDGCEISDPKNSVYTVSCIAGAGRFGARATRSFRLIPEVENNGAGRRYQFETPLNFSGHQCPQGDEWGVYGYNDRNAAALGGACIPRPLWNRNKYLASTPSAWLYEANNFNGWGYHPEY